VLAVYCWGRLILSLRWSFAQHCCFQAIRSGVLCHKGRTLRFLTLTSCVGMARSIEACFKLLVERIERMTPGRFVELGFVSAYRMEHYFPGLGHDEFVDFDYLSVLTSEGASGVLHILYFGDYLPERWLKIVWSEITGGAWIANISIVNVSCDDAKAVSFYVVNQCKVFNYVAGQSKYVHHSYSRDWVYRGWRSDFDKLKSFCRIMELHTERYPTSVISSDFWKEWFYWLSSRKFYNSNLDLWIENNIC